MLVLTIFSYWEENWTLEYNSMAFCNLLKCYVACQLVSQLLFNIFISNNQIPFHLLSKKHLVRYLQVPKYYEHKCKFQKWHSWAVIILILFRSNYLINRTITKDRCLRFQAWIYQNVSNEFLSAWFKFRAKMLEYVSRESDKNTPVSSFRSLKTKY